MCRLNAPICNRWAHFCKIGESESTSDLTPVSGRGRHVYENAWVERPGPTAPQAVLCFIRRVVPPTQQFDMITGQKKLASARVFMYDFSGYRFLMGKQGPCEAYLPSIAARHTRQTGGVRDHEENDLCAPVAQGPGFP
jgi:hypothetical protein